MLFRSGVDLSPIADLMKSEVYKLGAELGVHEDILTAAPTDGLHSDGRTDEDQIKATYDELEWAMKTCEEKWNGAGWELSEFKGREAEVLKIYLDFHNQNKHKMGAIPVCEIEHLR